MSGNFEKLIFNLSHHYPVAPELYRYMPIGDTMKILFNFLIILILFAAPITSFAHESLEVRIKLLETVLGGYPPNINSQEELDSIKDKYLSLKSELDEILIQQPNDVDFLFMRGHLQSMGHNFDHPGAWQGSTDDFIKLLRISPNHIPALIELGNLWVNSDPNLAPKAENLFRAAQCYAGSEPMEGAQQGIFFALYYQGKTEEAFKQSLYLVKQWPQNEKYLKLNDATRAVLERNKKNVGDILAEMDNLVMESCN